jgi:outer membrane protein assembly factor BamE (lipoprotein component of BamABCDE complex)
MMRRILMANVATLLLADLTPERTEAARLKEHERGNYPKGKAKDRTKVKAARKQRTHERNPR